MRTRKSTYHISLQETFSRGLVVACRSESEAKRIIKQANKLGFLSGGKKWNASKEWKEYKENLCLHFSKGYSCNPAYAKRFGYPTINSLDIP